MSKITAQSLKELLPQLITEILGDPERSFEGLSPLENVKKGSLIYIQKDRHVEAAKASQASVVLAKASLKTLLKDLPSGQTWVLSPNPELAMAYAKGHFVQATPYRAKTEGIHKTAQIDPSAQIDGSATIGPNVVIGPRVRIGANTFVGANCVIEADASIDKNSTIHPLVYVGHSCIIGQRCEIKSNATIGSEGYGYAHDEKGRHHRIPHSGRVVLQDDVHVGANTCIDRGSLEDTVIGSGTKIDNQCHLAHNTIIGKNGLVTAQFGAAGSCTIGDNFISGGKASLGGHLKVPDNVHMAALSATATDIPKSGQYGGYPLQPLQDFLRTNAALLHLPELRKQIAKLLKSE